MSEELYMGTASWGVPSTDALILARVEEVCARLTALEEKFAELLERAERLAELLESVR